MNKIRLLIADDHAILRAGLASLFHSQPDLEVVGEAADGHDAMTKVCALQPDVLTLDLTMPGVNSIQMIERLRHECPQTRVLVLTMHDEPAYMRTVLAAGGLGYLIKTAADTELLAAVRSVAGGHIFVDPSLSEYLVQAFAGKQVTDGDVAQDGLERLSEREREVIKLLAEGHTNQESADRLFLSVKTVETYRARIGNKLDLHSRADIIRYAVEIGLLRPTNLAIDSRRPAHAEDALQSRASPAVP
jgi:two-component system response regulator NreC